MQAGNRVWWRPWLCFLILYALALGLEVVRPNFYFHDDSELQYIPTYLDAARAWREGSLPILSRGTWQGTSQLGEYQAGVLNPVHQALICLATGLTSNLSRVAAIIGGFYLALAGTAGFCLSRQRGWPLWACWSCALSFALQGFLVRWCACDWLPGCCANAWLYWLFLNLQKWREGQRHYELVCGLNVFLLLTSGWPVAVVMGGLLCLYALVETRGRRGLRLLLALGAGALLAAPALLPFLDYGRFADRLNDDGRFDWTLRVALPSLLDLINPALLTHWDCPWDEGSLFGSEVNVGLIGAVGALSLLRSPRAVWQKDRRTVIFCLFCLALCLLPNPKPLRHSFRWLALMLPCLSLLGHQAFVDSKIDRRPAGLLLLGSLGLAMAWHQPIASLYALFVGLLLIALGSPRPATLLSINLLTLLAPHFLGLPPDYPTFQIAQAYAEAPSLALEPRHRYFCAFAAAQTPWIDFRWSHPLARCPGNLSLLRGLDFVSGYSPLKPFGARVPLDLNYFGVSSVSATSFQSYCEKGGYFDWIGVDTILLDGPNRALGGFLQARGWIAAGEDADLQAWQRPAPRLRAVAGAVSLSEPLQARLYLDQSLLKEQLPVVYTPHQRPAPPHKEVFSSCQASLREETRLGLTIDVVNTSDQKSAIVIARPWVPGYRARLGATETPVRCANLSELYVEIPPGYQGPLIVSYWPAALSAGLLASALGALLLLGLGVRRPGQGIFSANRVDVGQQGQEGGEIVDRFSL